MCAAFGYLPSVPSTVKTFTSIMMLTAVLSGGLWAQTGGNSVTQSVTIEVKPIAKITVTGNPNALVITDAVAGGGLSSVSDNHTAYSLTTNLDNMKIVASINDPMPSGTQLKVQLSSSKAESAGLVDLTKATTPIDVVTGINRCSDTDQTINYTFAANADVSEIPTQTRVVTLTLTN
jgi:hypothetical protein